MANWFSSFFSNLGGYIRPSDKYKKHVVVNNIQVRPVHRQTQDVEKWRNAMKAAEGWGQQRHSLYDLYTDILLDGFLKRCIQKRIQSTTNRKLIFMKDGEEVESISDLTKMTFFKKAIKHVLEARFWGHTLLELDWSVAGYGTTALVDRRHVKPRYGIVTVQTNDLQGIKYREKPFDRNCLEAGEDEDLGLILEACLYVILKRGNFSNWADFAEVFGMPFRHGKYNNDQTRKVLEEALENMGAAGYVVSPDDAEIEFTYPAGVGQGVDIFQMLHDMCNREIAITILGSTMGMMESKYGGYAQAKEQGRQEDEIYKDDREYVLAWMNETLIPYLERIGLDASGGEFSYVEDETMSKKEKLEILATLKRNGVPVGLSTWYETAGVPMPEPDDLQDDPEEDIIEE